ncbi:MAG: GDSL-type esterase/lipase family protein [Mangrovibacterium sp.]
MRQFLHWEAFHMPSGSGEDVAGKMIPDILFLEAAVNDQANGYTDTEQVRSMEGIVRQAKEINPAIDIVILYFADPEKITDYARGDIPKVIMNHEKVASHYNISSINLAHEVSDRISAGEFSWKYDFVDLHPSLFGQELYFASIKSYLEHEWNTGTNITVKKTNNPPLLDKYSFIHGNYYPIEKANLKRGFIYDPSFYPGDGLKVRPGFINVPMLVAESPGAELELRFNGKAIGLNIISGGDAGIIEYNVDGKPFIKVDLFTQWSRRLHLPWYILLEDELPDKEHLLRIRLTEDHNPESKGTVCRIVRFLVNDSNLNREEQNHIGYQK